MIVAAYNAIVTHRFAKYQPRTGLSVHLNQVHKETLSQVENALPNRQGLEVEIFGMEGIPQDALEQHRSRIIQNFYQAQEDRRIATGNPASGQATPRKKVRVEASEDLLKRLAEFRAQKKAGILPPAAEERTNTPPTEQVRETNRCTCCHLGKITRVF